MQWQAIISRDPYLAGHLASIEHEWEFDAALNEWTPGLQTGDQVADSVNLTEDRRVDFLRGWDAARIERDQERQQEQAKKLATFLDACSDGYDPVERTSWKGILS